MKGGSQLVLKDEQDLEEKQGRDVSGRVQYVLDQKDRKEPLFLIPGCQSLVFQRKASRHTKGEDRNKVTSRSIGLDTATSQPTDSRNPPAECLLSPSGECWTRERRPTQYSSFSGFSSNDSVLRELDDGQFDQEDGVTQVTCM